ncbi:MAG: bacteriohemerythrin [Chloroherpetonaceae bacterium]
MKRFEWTPELSTGVNAIDVQHKELMHAINDLGENLELGNGIAAIKKTVSFLKYYSDWQFNQEQDCAAKSICPIVENNKQARAQFIQMLDKLSQDLRESDNPESIAKEAHNNLSKWFEEHVVKNWQICREMHSRIQQGNFSNLN